MKLKKLISNSNVKKDEIRSSVDFRKKLLKDSLFFDLYFKYKSPRYDIENNFFQKNILGDTFVYERNITYENIESQYNKLLKTTDKIFLFNSGMAAITILIKTYIEGYNKTKLNILSTLGYFETDKFFRKLSFPVVYTSVNNEVELVNEIISNEIDILFIEPVTYSLNMNIFDIYHIIKVFNDSTDDKRMRLIIIDVTLASHFNIDIDKIRKILIKENIICAVVQSLIKLYQFGFELTSAGMAVLICNSSNLNIKNEFEKYENTIIENRMLYSTNLNLSSLRILTNKFLFDEIYLNTYIRRIHENNSYVAKNISNKKYKKIVHPSFIDTTYPYAQAPFVLIQLKNDIESEYDSVIKKIFDTLGKDDIFVDYGSSFGFYKTRIEKIIYDINYRKCFLKISVGYCKKYINDIIQLLNSI